MGLGVHFSLSLSLSLSAGKKNKLLKDGEGGLQGEHIREGLSAIVSVKVGITCFAPVPCICPPREGLSDISLVLGSKVPNPEFEGQTKTRLGNPEVRKIVEAVTAEVCAGLWMT